jgi:bacterioferritin-associated ferredoxin
MKHLTDDEIIELVTASDTDKETMSSIAEANAHLVKCGECVRRVRAYQILAEGLIKEKEHGKMKETLKKQSLQKKTDKK